MKKLLFSAAAVAILSTPALAADVLPPAHDWSGLYVGLQAGYLFGDVDIENELAGGAINAQSSPDVDGFLGGLHAGFNHQIDTFVIGVEGDLNFSLADSDGFETAVNAAGVPIPPNQHSADVDWTASARLRLGLPIDNFMPYLTGGLAIAGAEFDLDHVVDDGTLDETMMGWTVGAGLEWAVSDTLSTRVEYRFSDYGSESDNVFPFFPTEEATAELETHQVTLGVSLHF
jgi:outer membrane immunogenic protein